MGLFDKMREPVFLKESSSLEKQLEILKELEPKLNEEGKELIRQDIKCLEYGIAGEKNIAFELKNSHMPMYILHDVCLEQGDLKAQIDYLVFTKKLCFVIECKHLYGNIEINSSGDFIRTMEFNGKKKKEGLYSPLTQNQRHLELMKAIYVEVQKNAFWAFMVDKFWDGAYQPIVVLANPKTILYDRYAKKEVKEKVIRADQLVSYIKEQCRKSSAAESSEKEMLTWAQNYLKLHKEQETDYTQKYEKYMQKEKLPEETETAPEAVKTEEAEKAETIEKPEAKAEAEIVKNAEEQRICPKCQGILIKRKGKYGEFFGCQNFPKCRHTEKL